MNIKQNTGNETPKHISSWHILISKKQLTFVITPVPYLLRGDSLTDKGQKSFVRKATQDIWYLGAEEAVFMFVWGFVGLFVTVHCFFIHALVKKASNHHANLPLEMYSFTL